MPALHSRGGAPFKAAFCIAALSASRFKPAIWPFYIRMIDNGKEKKAALTACIGKLLTTLNAMLRDNKRLSPATRKSSQFLQ